ncbi:hypothetical protein EXU30_05030 [Shewanella maritima]|uniref:Lipoprotein n=1 Tax=Shewanella maritima TaxID=2520507 RepID=A0A411PEX1_9GAMM|nr:hypothetical protein [Shewanella maritima]QBF82137.1 hypothetical protein EXU30_05030 [Shewanella maritima]
MWLRAKSFKLLGFVASISLLLTSCASQVEYAPCGVVAAFKNPAGEDSYYRAVVTHLNGMPVISRPYYILPVGEYEFTLAELISAPQLKVSLSARGTKTVTVIVEDDTRYHLAAKFKTDKIYAGKNSDYWQAVVWQQESYQCEASSQLVGN